MSEIPYSKKIDPKTKAIAIIVMLLVIGLVIGLVLSSVSLNYARKNREKLADTALFRIVSTLYTLSNTLICMNIALLLGLLWVYLDTFRKTKSSFLLGLVLFIGVLLVQSFLSIPLVQGVVIEELSLLKILPNLFETIALIILFYLSME